MLLPANGFDDLSDAGKAFYHEVCRFQQLTNGMKHYREVLAQIASGSDEVLLTDDIRLIPIQHNRSVQALHAHAGKLARDDKTRLKTLFDEGSIALFFMQGE